MCRNRQRLRLTLTPYCTWLSSLRLRQRPRRRPRYPHRRRRQRRRQRHRHRQRQRQRQRKRRHPHPQRQRHRQRKHRRNNKRLIARHNTVNGMPTKRAVITTDQTNNGIRSHEIPVDRILITVVIKFTAPKIDDTPAK